MTNLIIATTHNNLQKVKKLLKSIFNINEIDEYGDSALLHAAWNCNIEIAELLLDSGADIDLEDSDGETALFSVVQNTIISIEQKYKMIKFLLKHNANCNHINKNNRNIIQVIEDQGNLDVLYCLFNVEATYRNDLPIWGEITPHLSHYN